MNKISCEQRGANCKNRDKCIFSGLPISVVNEIAEHAILNTYKKNQTIFIQDHPSRGVFCIYSGKVKVVIVNIEGKESIVRLASDGDLVGHRSLFGNGYYQASAIALEESVICCFEKDFFLKMVEKYPAVSFNLLSRLSQGMGSAEAHCASLSYKNVRERLAGLLLNLSKSYGVKEDTKIRLDIKLTREDMSKMIGTTHETMGRLFTEFKTEGIVIEEGKIIFIVDLKKLLNFANEPETQI